MSKRDEFSRTNLRLASDLIARRPGIRDEYLLGQPFYMDLMRYIADVLEITLRPRAHVLEVSCGTGILARLLLEQLPDIRLAVSDISPETVELAKRRTARHAGRVRFLVKDNATYSFSGKYDAVVVTNAMRLTFIDYARLYRNFHEVLKSNGIVLIAEAVVSRKAQDFLMHIGDVLNDAKAKPTYEDRWFKFTRSKAFTERVDTKDILRVVKYYPPSFHIRKLKAAGFDDARVIYQKYHTAIIAGLKGRMSFAKRP